MHLFAAQDFGDLIVVFGSDLRKNRPIFFAKHLEEKDFGHGNGLADGFGFPMFLIFDVEVVIADLLFNKLGGITGKMLLYEPERSIVGMTGSR